MPHMSELAMDAEQEQQAQAHDEAELYNDCLIALADAMSKGCSLHTLQTMKYQMNVNQSDYQVLMDHAMVAQICKVFKPAINLKGK